MNVEEFNYMSDLVYKQSGLVLNAEKKYLLESRLTPVARQHGIESVDALVRKLRATNDNALISDVTEAMTTNESYFFRDTRPFDTFREVVLPQLLENRKDKKSFRIWCAAASTGQEPYSLAMILAEEQQKLAGWRYDIVGTDISPQVLNKARSGIYSQFEVQRGMPIQLLTKYFNKQDDAWVISAELRNKVQYRTFNLLEDPSILGRFDVVFCRNVLIYFDPETKSRVLTSISKLMPDDGIMFLGAAETVLGISDKFKPYGSRSGIYSVADRSSVTPNPPIAVKRIEPCLSTQT